MLSANSVRERVTFTIKKENKETLERMAEGDNRNMSRQIDFLIENYKTQAVDKLLARFDEADARIVAGEKWLTTEELKDKLGLIK